VFEGDEIGDLYKEAGETLDKMLLNAAVAVLTVRIDIRESLNDSGYDMNFP